MENYGFVALENEELLNTDGGSITITVGAVFGCFCFLGGFIAGLAGL